MTINPTEINDALTLVTSVMPQALAAYSILKVIWQRTNPGKTEADYLSFLQTSAQTNTDESSAILKADGYVQDAAGNWSKPSA